jgi:hypothetical protein
LAGFQRLDRLQELYLGAGGGAAVCAAVHENVPVAESSVRCITPVSVAKERIRQSVRR